MPSAFVVWDVARVLVMNFVPRYQQTRVQLQFLNRESSFDFFRPTPCEWRNKLRAIYVDLPLGGIRVVPGSMAFPQASQSWKRDYTI